MGQKKNEKEKKKGEREGREREKETKINVLVSALLPYVTIISFHSGMCAEGNFREAFVYAKCYVSQCNVGRLVARWLV